MIQLQRITKKIMKMLQKYKYFITKLEKVRVYNSLSKEGSRVEPLNKETIKGSL